MTPELLALGAVVVYGLGVLTGLAIGRRRCGAGQFLSTTPPATRRADRKRRLKLGLSVR